MATNLRTTGERHQFCSLQGRGALVTGASGGIGLAIVERLAECGVNVCIVARRVEKLNELKEKLETEYPDVTIFPLQLDVSKTSEEEMLKIPEKVPFQVDILVNNAGLALGTEAVDTNSISSGWRDHRRRFYFACACLWIASWPSYHFGAVQSLDFGPWCHHLWRFHPCLDAFMRSVPASYRVDRTGSFGHASV